METASEKIIIWILKRIVIVLACGTASYCFGWIFWTVLLHLYYRDPIILDHYRPTYIFVSAGLGMLIGLLPLSVLAKVRRINELRFTWMVTFWFFAICSLLIVTYSFLIHLIVRNIISDTP